MVFSGKNMNRMEIVEIPSHRFFIGCQFHPEFKSRPEKPAPLFKGFVEAAVARGQATSQS
jgi:CTP synthase